MARNAELPAGFARYRVGAGQDRDTRPDDTGCGVLHADMDAFFAAVELLDRPEVAHQPVVVAAAGPRAVVLSANYPARRFGVHSAMPAATARRLCPHAVHIPPSRGRYGAVSDAVMSLFRQVTPLVEPLSLDEAFLDVSGALRRLQSTPADVATMLREQVVTQQGITCSVGVAPVKFVAKLASGMAKPDGMMVVPAREVLDFLHPLPVSALSGVGTRTAEQCRRAGLETVGDVARSRPQRLRRSLGRATGERLYALAHGQEDGAVVPDRPDRSAGAERTFDTDLHDAVTLRRELLRLSERTAVALRHNDSQARTVSIKIRFGDFRTVTRSHTLSAPTDVAQVIYTTVERLFAEHDDAMGVRLIGVRATGLSNVGSGEQLSLDGRDSHWRAAEAAAEDARSKFGPGVIRPAALLDDRSPDDP